MLGKLALGVLGAALVLGPLPAGSQGARARWILAGACFLSAALLSAHRLLRRRETAADGMYWVFAAVGGMILLEILPLPRGLVSLVSPARMAFQGQVEHACSLARAGWLPLATCTGCARDSLVLIVASACAYFVASDYASRTDRAVRILRCIAVIGAALAALGAAGQLVHGGRLTATFTNANRLASLFALATGAAVALALIERRRRTLWLVCAAASQLGLFLTFSRMGIASAAAGAAAVILVRRKELRKARTVAAVASVLLAMLALNAAAGLSPALERYSMLFEPGALGGGRLACWRDAVALFADFPVTGSGAGSFKHVYAAYQDPSLAGWYKFAHNDVLNVLCDMGPLAVAAAAGGVVFWYARAFSAVRPRGELVEGSTSKVAAVRADDGRLKAIATGSLFGVTAVLVHSLADYPLRQPAVAVTFFTLAGVCSGAARRKLLPFSRRRPWATRAALGVSALGFVACVWLFAAAQAASAGNHELASGIDPLSAEAPFLAASDIIARVQKGELPPDALPKAELPRGAHEPRSRARGASSRGDWPPGHLKRPWGLVTKSLRRNPMDARAVYLAGALRLFAWDARESDRAVGLALTLAPAWPDVGMKVGNYFLARWRRTGRKDTRLRERAIDALARAARVPGGIAAVGRLLSGAGALDELWKETLPDTPETLAFMGRTALSKRDHARAIALLEEASRRGAEVSVELARAFFYAKRPRECAARLKALGLRKMRGVLLSRPEDGLAVCAALREAGEEGPALDAVEGRLFLRLGDAVRATKKLLGSAEEVRDPDVWGDLARAEFVQGMLSRATDHASYAIRLAPTDPGLRLLRGRILEERKMLSAAEAEYRRARLYGPRSFEAARRLAAVLRAQGDVFEAVGVLEEAARRKDAPAKAHFLLAVACEELARYDQAVEEAGKACELRPEDARYRKLLRELKARLYGR